MLRLGRQLKYGINFDVVGAFRGLKAMIRSPVKHLKSILEPSGSYVSGQIQITSEGFDEVAGEWQAFMGHHPYDMMIYGFLQATQPTNFGTIDNPCVVFTADTPFRYIACTGPQKEEDYQSHELMWMMLREGPLQRCLSCGQVFKLVRLRDEANSEMNYYMPNFNQMWIEDMGEHDYTVHFNVFKLVTHYEPTIFQTPEDTYHFEVNSDDHDRMLTDPAYRLQRQTEASAKARVYQYAMAEFQNQKKQIDPYKQPISKQQFVNLFEAELALKIFDRTFNRIIRYHSRRFVDPVNHQRREQRMLQRSKFRWDGVYTIFTGDLTEEQQRYNDYFETELTNYPSDEVEERLIDQELLMREPRYRLSRFDFIEGYTSNPEDDQTSYIEKKLFKFKFRKSLDSISEYARKETRMRQKQQERFEKNKSLELVANYAAYPQQHQNQYFNFIANEGVQQYKDYFETQNDPFDNILLDLHKSSFAMSFVNYQIPAINRDAYVVLPLSKWNNELGFWPNAVERARQILTLGSQIQDIQNEITFRLISGKQIFQSDANDTENKIQSDAKDTEIKIQSDTNDTEIKK